MKRIIIVDDEELMRYSLTAAFRNDAVEVVAVGDGKTAFQVLGLAAVDLCILDVHLPDMSGLTIMEQLRRASPGTRIIIMTGSEVTDAMFKTVRENAHALLAKPFELEQLKAFVARLLDADGPLPEAERAALKDDMPSLKWIDGDFRKCERRPLACRVTCLSDEASRGNPSVPIDADVLDISDSGMCIVTQERLEPGCLLLFNETPCQCTGMVKWSMSVGREHAFRAGIQFVERSGTA